MPRRNIHLLSFLGVEVGRRFAFYSDVLCKRVREEGSGWEDGGGRRRGRRLAILGDSVDTMGSQYITSPNPLPPLSSLSLFLRRFSFTSPAFLLTCPPLWFPFLRSSTNEAPRCRNSLGADVIAATAFLERVIVQQRRNGIAREKGDGRKVRAEEGGARWGWWRREHGEESPKNRRSDASGSRVKWRGAGGLGDAITAAKDGWLRKCEMSHTARCIVDGTEPKSNLPSVRAIENKDVRNTFGECVSQNSFARIHLTSCEKSELNWLNFLSIAFLSKSVAFSV